MQRSRFPDRQGQSDNHIEQILNCKFVAHVRTLKKGICKRTFGLMQTENLLLNCIL